MLDLVKMLPVFLQLLLVSIGVLTAMSAFVNTVMRLLPAAWIQSVEKNQPRLAHLARATRAGGSDLLKMLRSLYAFLMNSPFVPSQSMPPEAAPALARQAAPPRSNGGFVHHRVLQRAALAAMLGLALGSLYLACSSTQRRVTAGVIVSAGGAVEGMRQSNRSEYVRATDALRARVQGDEYARQSEPIDTAFRARGRAIRDLTAVLYAAARLNDTQGTTPAQYAGSARDILEQLHDLTAILRDGSVLPPIPIPPAVDDAEAGLQALATMVAGGAR